MQVSGVIRSHQQPRFTTSVHSSGHVVGTRTSCHSWTPTRPQGSNRGSSGPTLIERTGEYVAPEQQGLYLGVGIPILLVRNRLPCVVSGCSAFSSCGRISRKIVRVLSQGLIASSVAIPV